ncbi:MAG: radical SAM protein, partial [Candidatus Latescibacteria bacterium]|nr:radical SAM protein [Candidatus Latescibacterota bacterium]
MPFLHIDEINARSVLVAQNPPGEPITEYTLNPYSGCGMGCSYCYVMKFPFAYEYPQIWGEWVQPKLNAPFLLGKARAKIYGRKIFMGSATDPYQYIERKYRLSRKCLEVLADCNLKGLTVHTRSHLILDDLDVLTSFGDRLRVGFSVPTDDDRVRKRTEPKAPKISVRLKTMKRLREAGIYVNASLAPVLYCHPRKFAAQIAEAADGVYFGKMDYTDKTAIKTMPKARRYFNSSAYEDLVEEL